MYPESQFPFVWYMFSKSKLILGDIDMYKIETILKGICIIIFILQNTSFVFVSESQDFVN